MRRILGISLSQKILPAIDQARLEFCEAVLEFIVDKRPSSKLMGGFIGKYKADHGGAISTYYKWLGTLKDMNLVKYFCKPDDYYAINKDKIYKDVTAIKQFLKQIIAWERSNN